MAHYSKSFEDYFRIPVLLKSITPLSQKSLLKASNLLYYKSFSLEVDERYSRLQTNSNTQIIKQRPQCTQKLYLVPEDFNNDWPQFQIIYKTRMVIGLADSTVQEKQIQDILGRIKLEVNTKFIGVIYLGSQTYEGVLRKENYIKIPDINQEEFSTFIQPWMYNCLAIIQSQICKSICETKREDEGNKTIVFNRMQQKFQAKIMKRKKKYRCVKLCGDYCLMLQLYKEAFSYFNQAQELLKKIDDYLWILGALQGKLACLVACSSLDISNQEQYIEQLIAETYLVAKKTKNWNFQCENYFKVARLYINQPQRFDELIRVFLLNYGKNFSDDQKFLLFTTLGSLYESCGWFRKRNYYYFLAAMIHLNKTAGLSSLLLIQIQKTAVIKEWPYLYKQILQQIIHDNKNSTQNNEFYLQLLSKCANSLSEKQITRILSELNYSNNQLMELKTLQFIKLQQFYVKQSLIKPKQNRIGNRESPRKVGGSFFISWKRDQNLLFQQNQQVILKGTIANKIPFPIRLKIAFQIHSLVDPAKISSEQQLYFYVQPSNLHKFQMKIRLTGQNEQIWVIDKVNLILWNFNYQIPLSNPVKYQIYQRQPELDLIIDKQLKLQQSSNLYVETWLKAGPANVPICMVKLNISIYYNIDVGFQQNEIVLREDNKFMGLDFKNPKNICIQQLATNDLVQPYVQNGILRVGLRKLKTHRRSVNRIEFTLEYIRSMNTKYQISKHYVTKCQFYEQFVCKVQQIATPMTEKISKDLISTGKIIEESYKIKVRICKIKKQNTNQSYKFHLKDKSYEINSNTDELLIEIINSKIQFDEKPRQVQEIAIWENMYNTKIRGELLIEIPFMQIMRKSQKKVILTKKQSYLNNHKQVVIQYTVTSNIVSNLSHSFSLSPVEIQIDRMYVIRGKNKIEEQATHLSNRLQIIFGSKCRNSYQICIMFKDGWSYWHEQIICVN